MMVGMQLYRDWARTHYNFMTPKILKVERVGDFFIELSEGEGFGGESLFGVSVIRYVDGKFTPIHRLGDGVSCSFRERGEAVKHFLRVRSLASKA
jgi:hypothetical protein